MDATELRGWGLGLLQVAGLALFIAAWYSRELFIEKPGVVFGAALALVSGFMFLASAWHAEWVLAGVTAAIIIVGLLIVYAASSKQ